MNTNSKMIIGAVVLVAVGFFVGMSYGKSLSGAVATTGARNGTANALRSGRGNFAGGAGGGFVAGTILSKDAQSLTISVMGGGSKLVFLGTSTPVMKSVEGTLSDLTVGANVMVSGQTEADGSITAKSINLR